MSSGNRFLVVFSDRVEDVEHYRPGGFHPIAIGDKFSENRYTVVHKLGHGSFSTVWLARDRDSSGRFVTLKALRADASSEPPNKISALVIPQMLRSVPPPDVELQTVDDHFLVNGPNGTHLFLVCSFAGPNMRAMYDGGRHLMRADLARKLSKQVATALYHMHRARVVHGDLTLSNILFLLSPAVQGWSDSELYAHFGDPFPWEVITVDGSPRPACAPACVIEKIDDARRFNASLLQESVMIGDFGQSYVVDSPPPNYKPGTALDYWPPELRFESHVGLEADVWMLACVIYAMRSGDTPFFAHFAGDDELIKQTVMFLGRLPDPWWSAWKLRSAWFDEDGEPRDPTDKTSIREELSVMNEDTDESEPLSVQYGSMLAATNGSIPEEEVELLGDLLEKMFRYRPEERIKMEEVMSHPWFAYTG